MRHAWLASWHLVPPSLRPPPMPCASCFCRVIFPPPPACCKLALAKPCWWCLLQQGPSIPGLVSTNTGCMNVAHSKAQHLPHTFPWPQWQVPHLMGCGRKQATNPILIRDCSVCFCCSFFFGESALLSSGWGVLSPASHPCAGFIDLLSLACRQGLLLKALDEVYPHPPLDT